MKTVPIILSDLLDRTSTLRETKMDDKAMLTARRLVEAHIQDYGMVPHPDKMKEAIAKAIEDAHRPFYGAECTSYPACRGGCGLGCTYEIVNRPPPHLR